MKKEKIEEILNAMQGITYPEWERLKHEISVTMDARAREMGNKLLMIETEEFIAHAGKWLT